jgi:hypothetical protein
MVLQLGEYLVAALDCLTVNRRRQTERLMGLRFVELVVIYLLSTEPHVIVLLQVGDVQVLERLVGLLELPYNCVPCLVELFDKSFLHHSEVLAYLRRELTFSLNILVVEADKSRRHSLKILDVGMVFEMATNEADLATQTRVLALLEGAELCQRQLLMGLDAAYHSQL